MVLSEFCFTSDLQWIQKYQDQLRRFISSSFLVEILQHLRKVGVLTLAENTDIMEAGQLQDQINMLTTIVSGKESQCSDALQAFIETSDSPAAQLIIHGKRLKLK